MRSALGTVHQSALRSTISREIEALMMITWSQGLGTRLGRGKYLDLMSSPA